MKANKTIVTEKEIQERVKKHQRKLNIVKNEISKAVVGQPKIIDALLRAIISNGHVLVEGVPGLAKTLIIRAFASVTDCGFNRIQFTADLLPTDIIGITTYDKKKGFYVLKGPVFHNFILADEINRAPPKVQSALLEAMQEKQVTIGRETFPLPNPFFVLATQNPIESLGTYPLPEAQIDRFMFKLFIDYPLMEEEQLILEQNITLRKFKDFELKSVISPEEILNLQKDVREIYLNKKIEGYILRLVDATRHPDKYDIKLGEYVEWGASPRASIGLYIASKAQALLTGKTFVTPHDVKQVAHDVLRHRIILSYEGQANSVSVDDIIDEILSKAPL